MRGKEDFAEYRRYLFVLASERTTRSTRAREWKCYFRYTDRMAQNDERYNVSSTLSYLEMVPALNYKPTHNLEKDDRSLIKTCCGNAQLLISLMRAAGLLLAPRLCMLERKPRGVLRTRIEDRKQSAFGRENALDRV